MVWDTGKMSTDHEPEVVIWLSNKIILFTGGVSVAAKSIFFK